MVRRQRKADLESIISSLGEYKRRGDWLNFHCPFHHGGKLNFGINIRSRWFSCFGCGESGSLSDLSERLTDGAVAGGLLERRSMSVCGDRGRSSAVAPAFLRIDDVQVRASPVGMTPDQFDRVYSQLPAGSGSVVENRAMKYLEGRGVDVREFEVGLISTDEFACRVVFPFRQDGKVVFCQGRSIYDIPLKTRSVEESAGWTGKSNVLWNYDGLKLYDCVCVCEGIFDSISVYTKTGWPSTCLLGTSISYGQIRLLRRLGIRDAVVMLDNDANTAAVLVALKLYECKFHVRVVQWPYSLEKADPGSSDANTISSLIHSAAEIDRNSYLSMKYLSR